jgi:hypothetical protein
LVGEAESPKANSTQSDPVSVAHVIFKVTPVVLVDVAQLFIVKDHHVGGVIS